MNDETDPNTEERLRRALAARDAEVRPSRDALASIRTRGNTRKPWARAPLAIAAALALIGGIVAGVALLNDDDGEPEVAVEGPTTTEAPPTSTADPTTTTEPIEPITTTIPPSADPISLSFEGLVVWPRDSRSFDSMESAAFGYVTEVLGVAEPILTYDCCDDRVGVAHLRAQGEGGRELDRDAAVLTLVSTDGTWEIVLVESDSMVIDSATSGPEGIVVSGHGTGFEGTGRLTATSACDPESVVTEIVAVGAGPEPAPFTATIAAPDCAVAIIELADDPAADGATPAVSSLAVATSAPPDVVVMRVPENDVLNVRSGPGTGNEVVATLPPDASGIGRTGATESVDGDDWWEIVTPDGSTGWAHSGFLSVQFPLDEGLASNLAFAARGLVDWLDEDVPPTSPTTRPPLPPPAFSPLGVEVGGIGIFPDAASPFQIVDPADISSGSTTTYDWEPFPDDPACGPDCERTVAEFLGLGELTDPPATYNTEPISYEEPNEQFLVGIPPLYTERFTTVRIEIPASSDQDNDWRTYTVVFDFRNSNPEIIAIWRWGWTP